MRECVCVCVCVCVRIQRLDCCCGALVFPDPSIRATVFCTQGLDDVVEDLKIHLQQTKGANPGANRFADSDSDALVQAFERCAALMLVHDPRLRLNVRHRHAHTLPWCQKDT